jgi:hypothetical protein
VECYHFAEGRGYYPPKLREVNVDKVKNSRFNTLSDNQSSSSSRISSNTESYQRNSVDYQEERNRQLKMITTVSSISSSNSVVVSSSPSPPNVNHNSDENEDADGGGAGDDTASISDEDSIPVTTISVIPVHKVSPIKIISSEEKEEKDRHDNKSRAGTPKVSFLVSFHTTFLTLLTF